MFIFHTLRAQKTIFKRPIEPQMNERLYVSCGCKSSAFTVAVLAVRCREPVKNRILGLYGLIMYAIVTPRSTTYVRIRPCQMLARITSSVSQFNFEIATFRKASKVKTSEIVNPNF